jgi:hypothetical protein
MPAIPHISIPTVSYNLVLEGLRRRQIQYCVKNSLRENAAFQLHNYTAIKIILHFLLYIKIYDYISVISKG